MAVDAALHACFAPGRDQPVLRLYSWRPACLSLGYAQPIADVDLATCQATGVEVVRRPSGGRAVLHDRELTYAVVAAIDDPTIGGSITRSYETIAAGLLAGLRTLGVGAVLAPGRLDGDLPARRSGACFAAATRHEVLWQGRKLVGSAQARRAGALLQHGSIRLAPSAHDLARLLRAADAGALAARLRAASGTVADALGVAPDASAAARVLAPAFAAALGIDLHASDLTPAERDLAAHLHDGRFAREEWTLRR